MTEKQPPPVLSIHGLTKDFPGVRAIDNVSLSIESGTIHCLVGENGAGKSTLIKMLTGALLPTSGTMRLNGSEYKQNNLQDAREEIGRASCRERV